MGATLKVWSKKNPFLKSGYFQSMKRTWFQLGLVSTNVGFICESWIVLDQTLKGLIPMKIRFVQYDGMYAVWAWIENQSK